MGRLYPPPGVVYSGCRHCYDPTYEICQMSHGYDGIVRLITEGAPDTGPKHMRRLLAGIIEPSVG